MSTHQFKSIVADTDHGQYEAFPWRESEDGPAGAIATVFHEAGYIAGYVTGAVGAYTAHSGPEDGTRVIGARVTFPGAVSAVADHDGGFQS